MIVDCRTYTLRVGTQNAFVELYERHGRAVQQRVLGAPVGWYASEIGALNQIVHLWSYRSLDERARRRAALGREPAWQSYLQRAASMGAITQQENQILVPALHQDTDRALDTAGDASEGVSAGGDES